MGGGLAAAVESAVAAWKDATSSFQGIVTHEPWIGQDPLGEDSYDDPVPRRALIVRDPVIRGTAAGQELSLLAVVTFLETIPPHGADGRIDEPIDPRDRITLPDGRTGPIVSIRGFAPMWSEAASPFATRVGLGRAA